MSTYLPEIQAALRHKRFPLEDEKATQAAIADALAAVPQMSFEREVKIAGGVIDFLVGGYGGVGIEVKLKGQPQAIRRQLRAYAAEPRLEAIVLVTAKPVGVVEFLNGKRVVEFDLGRAWL